MDKRLTVHDVVRMRPCATYAHERVKALWAGRASLSPLEILALNIPIEDRLWCILRPEVVGERTCRILACDFAGHVLPIWEAQYPTDTRPRVAIETAIRHLNGMATREEVDAAVAAVRTAALAAPLTAADAAWAARDAAWAATWDARGAARAVARDAAGVAVRGVARAAVRAAAGVAAGVAEREWQLARAREVLAITEAPLCVGSSSRTRRCATSCARPNSPRWPDL